ncbi:hypothetical protein LPB67_08460 [Undibacterium sp. Jales W-56]|uniref:hypothetical protein n=1 Tax=Undibacterium sp. Jales W-56 TaxID=2897325 RepID=UPI0021D08A78|nr:hypothetical protein [Undibacterium sp. Jales W-56]MCU6433808.1 hypothetical protein [Undibacterium sp. Jales W-56]
MAQAKYRLMNVAVDCWMLPDIAWFKWQPVMWLVPKRHSTLTRDARACLGGGMHLDSAKNIFGKLFESIVSAMLR